LRGGVRETARESEAMSRRQIVADLVLPIGAVFLGFWFLELTWWTIAWVALLVGVNELRDKVLAGERESDESTDGH
jgi:hypothetical protein